jgi:hypothetical protein
MMNDGRGRAGSRRLLTGRLPEETKRLEDERRRGDFDGLQEEDGGADVEEEVELEQVQLHVQEEEEVAEVLFPFSAGLGAVHGDGAVDGNGGEKPSQLLTERWTKETERRRGGRSG